MRVLFLLQAVMWHFVVCAFARIPKRTFGGVQTKNMSPHLMCFIMWTTAMVAQSLIFHAENT